MSRFAVRLRRAATPGISGGGDGELYLTPATGSYGSGATVAVTIRENSGATSVNAVQANITYPAGLLQFQSINTSGSSFSQVVESTGGSGTVRIGSAYMGGSVTGDQLVAVVTFSVIGAGSASLVFLSDSAIVESTTSTDVCYQKTGATYTLT